LKVFPNDKQALLDSEGYEIYNRELMRKVFPRIIKEALEPYKGKKRKPEIRDVATFYFLLQSYIDGNDTRADGKNNDRFGACFIDYETIMEKLAIDRHRIKWLADILEANGIIRAVTKWDNGKKFKWYFPSFCPRISDDGYIIDEDGCKVIPDPAVYRPKKKTKEDAEYVAGYTADGKPVYF